MCTVSFVHSNDSIIITSNRDEKTARPVSIEPKLYAINNRKLFFPKDQKAGGTWFVADERGNVAVLLNGASEAHIPANNYIKSRGVVLLDIIKEDNPLETWNTINIEHIEPFTIVLFQQNKLFQLRWNGIEKEMKPLNNSEKLIWSSSTLYTPEIRRQREDWFNTFIHQKEQLTESDLKHFHLNTNTENKENGLIINRNNITKTFSVTQAVITKNKVSIHHTDLIHQKEYSETFITV